MPGCDIDPTATITGKSSLGKRVKVGASSRIDDCIIGDDVVIGDEVELSHCFIFQGTRLDSGLKKSRHYLSTAIIEPINLP
jgi:mannose-1-phosphate guanylyltransferase